DELFDRQRADDRPQRSLEDVFHDRVHLLGLGVEESLRRVAQRLDVAADLERGHALHLNLDALARHGVCELDTDLTRRQLQLADTVEQRPHERAPADHHLDALVARARHNLATPVEPTMSSRLKVSVDSAWRRNRKAIRTTPAPITPATTPTRVAKPTPMPNPWIPSSPPTPNMATKPSSTGVGETPPRSRPKWKAFRKPPNRSSKIRVSSRRPPPIRRQPPNTRSAVVIPSPPATAS